MLDSFLSIYKCISEEISMVTAKLKRRGLIAIAVLLLVGFGADIVKLFYLQVIKGEEYKTKAEAQQLSDTQIAADRGIIYDCNMNVIAESASAWLVYVNPSRIKDDAQRSLIASGLAEILSLKAENIKDKISNDKYSYVKIAGKVEYNEKSKITDFITDNDLYGIVSVDPDTKRYYPYSTFASSVIGFTGDGDSGRAGLELQYDDSLTGVAGRIITAKTARDGSMKSNYETIYDAERGVSHILTIDKNIQYFLEKGLKQALIENDAASAYGIVMEVETGAIKAMATMPDYDLNTPTVITDEETLKELAKITDEEKYAKAYNEKIYTMWRNRAISDTYEPGSVFKIFTASAAIEENAVPENFTYTCNGSIKVADNIIRCHNLAGHGTQTMTQGLMNSCNPFFITVGQKLGTERFFKYFEAFGFTEKTQIDLPGEASPVANVTYYTPDNMGIAELSSCAFGQTFQVSAIQMITAVCCVANDGKLMQPYLLQSMVDEDGNTVYEASPEVKRQVVSKKTSEKVIAMMEQVVADGTGKNAYVPGYRIAGKTGTSEKLGSKRKDGKIQHIASFSGCAPANDPKIAVLIVIDEPQSEYHGGGTIAAPVAGSIIEQTLKYLNVEPTYTDEELAKLNAATPEVSSMTVSAAKAALQSKGFTPRVIGNGETVVSQYPIGGQNISHGGVVILYTESDGAESEGTVPDLTGLSISAWNDKAVNAGFNIKISGASLNSEVVSYRQSVEPGTKCELGTTITVYFKTTTGVQDD